MKISAKKKHSADHPVTIYQFNNWYRAVCPCGWGSVSSSHEPSVIGYANTHRRAGDKLLGITRMV